MSFELRNVMCDCSNIQGCADEDLTSTCWSWSPAWTTDCSKRCFSDVHNGIYSSVNEANEAMDAEVATAIEDNWSCLDQFNSDLATSRLILPGILACPLALVLIAMIVLALFCRREATRPRAPGKTCGVEVNRRPRAFGVTCCLLPSLMVIFAIASMIFWGVAKLVATLNTHSAHDGFVAAGALCVILFFLAWAVMCILRKTEFAKRFQKSSVIDYSADQEKAPPPYEDSAGLE